MKEVSLVKMESEDTSASMLPSAEKYPAGSPIRSQLPAQVPHHSFVGGKSVSAQPQRPLAGKMLPLIPAGLPEPNENV